MLLGQHGTMIPGLDPLSHDKLSIWLKVLLEASRKNAGPGLNPVQKLTPVHLDHRCNYREPNELRLYSLFPKF